MRYFLLIMQTGAPAPVAPPPHPPSLCNPDKIRIPHPHTYTHTHTPTHSQDSLYVYHTYNTCEIFFPPKPP